MTRALALVVVIACSGSGCSYTTTVRGGPAGAELWIDEEPAGELAPRGEEVDVPISYGAPTWQVDVDGDEEADASGALERTRVEPFTAAALVGCSTLCASQTMGLGFCLANPSVLVCCLAPVNELFLLSAFNAMRTSLDNPSWPTVPVMMGCAVVGLLPLLFLPYALRVPDEVDLGTVDLSTVDLSTVAPPPDSVAELPTREVPY